MQVGRLVKCSMRAVRTIGDGGGDLSEGVVVMGEKDLHMKYGGVRVLGERRAGWKAACRCLWLPDDWCRKGGREVSRRGNWTSLPTLMR